jgi:nitroreductase
MEVIEAIRSRRSIRGFKPDPVPRKVLEELLDTCRWAPSAQNTQTWELAIVGGKVMAELKARFEANVKDKVKPNPDLPSIELTEIYQQRAIESRNNTDRHQFPPGTEDLDAKRAAYLLKGARLHDAPNGIIIYSDKSLDQKAIISAGIMAQTIALAAPAYGLGTCVTFRAVTYPDVLRELLGIPESKTIIIGIAIGYPDPESILNSIPRSRLPVETITQWHGF